MDALISDTGLTVVYEPESGFPVVDIVIVHGLQGHPYKTWACKAPRSDLPSAATSSVKVPDEENGSRKSYHRVEVLWILTHQAQPKSETPWNIKGSRRCEGSPSLLAKDLLPVQYPNARVLVYGYDTRVTKYFAGPTNENSIHSHGKDLLSSLAAFRKLDSPLILIAHSLGGIVVKEMLASSSNSTEYKLENVVASAAAVIFLGTPHRGSPDLATLGDRARSMINAFRMKTNPAILDALRLKTNDLERAQESFSAVWSRYDFRVKTFKEGMGLTGLDIGPFAKKVVPDYSSLLGDVRERAETIQANHMEMCRFAGLSDPNYGRICGEITSIYDWIVELNSTTAHHADSQSFAAETLSRPSHKSRAGGINERELFCLQSLAFPNMNQRAQNLETPAEGTCSWLFKHEAFVDWIGHKNQGRSCGLLWLRGKPGSGKSTLLKEALSRAREKSSSECHIASFFFNAKGDVLEHSPTGMLRSILHQICSQNTNLLEALADFAQRRRALSGEDMAPWETTELKSFFKSAIVGHNKEVIIFIDAIDECDSVSMRDVADFWRDITKTAHCAGVELSVCLSSRHFPAISVNDCPEIIMESHNYPDIVEFVRRRLDLGMSGQHITDQQTIQEKILEKSGGVFLWVSLVVKDILQKHDEGHGARSLLKHLNSVPQDLEHLFYQLLATGPFSTMVVKMFQWALLPSKPLRLHEWHHILAFIGNTTPSSLHQWERSDSYTKSDDQLEKRITHLSRGLLSFNIRSNNDDSHGPADESMSDRAGAGSLDLCVGETRVVQVIHESVRQYFMEGPGFSVLNPASVEKPLADAHLSIMNVCLDYILIEELDALVEARKRAQRRMTNRPARDGTAKAASSGSEKPRVESGLARPSYFWPARPTWGRASSVASFGSASSHDGRQTPVAETQHRVQVPQLNDTLPKRRKRSRGDEDSYSRPPSEGSNDNLLAFRNVKKLKGSAENNDIASRWLKEQSVEDHAYYNDTASISDRQSSGSDCTQILEAHAALLSYATFELFTHARKADAEDLDPSHIVKRLRDGAWNRWKALREDVDGRIELLYFAADMGWPSWLMADRVWRRHEVISSMELAIENGNCEVLAKLLHTFPLTGYIRETSRRILAFLASASDAVLLQAYLSLHPSDENGSIDSIMAMTDILESKDSDGRTALHLAVSQQNKAVVSVLLQHGADVSAVDSEIQTPLHLACTGGSRTALCCVSSSSNARSGLVELLLSHHAQVNAVDCDGWTPLSAACSNTWAHSQDREFRQDLIIVDLLLKHGADTTIRNSWGSLPLHEACWTSVSDPQNKLYMVGKLLDYDSAVNAVGIGGRTPLHDACSHPKIDTLLIKELLRRGANPTLRDDEGSTPLHSAVYKSSEQVVETLLSFSGTLVSAKNELGWTPLHLACARNSIAITRRLLEHGAEAYAVRNHNGESPADLARRLGSADVLKVLAEASWDGSTRGLLGPQGQRDD